MQDALVLTVLGMGTVLCVLFILSLMIRLSGKIVGSKKAAPAAAPAAKAAPAVKAAPAAAPAAKADDTAVIAVIAAAVAAYLGTSPSNLVVKPVTVSTAWSAAGMLENTKKF